MNKLQASTNKLFRDKDGKIIVMQKPNPPLIIWIICTVLSRLISNHGLSSLLSIVGTAALVLWAILEIVWGTTYFRRILGAVVLLVIVHSLFW